MKSKPSPLPNREREAIQAQLDKVLTAVKHHEENGRTDTYDHQKAARLAAALKQMEVEQDATST